MFALNKTEESWTPWLIPETLYRFLRCWNITSALRYNLYLMITEKDLNLDSLIYNSSILYHCTTLKSYEHYGLNSFFLFIQYSLIAWIDATKTINSRCVIALFYQMEAIVSISLNSDMKHLTFMCFKSWNKCFNIRFITVCKPP